MERLHLKIFSSNYDYLILEVFYLSLYIYTLNGKEQQAKHLYNYVLSYRQLKVYINTCTCITGHYIFFT